MLQFILECSHNLTYIIQFSLFAVIAGFRVWFTFSKTSKYISTKVCLLLVSMCSSDTFDNGNVGELWVPSDPVSQIKKESYNSKDIVKACVVYPPPPDVLLIGQTHSPQH